MAKLLRIFLITTLIFAGYKGLCQDLAMLHYTVDDGLPSNNVYHVYRDSKGYLWVTTDKGVARYNGIKFEVFNTFNGLPDNEIFIAQEDHQGRLWFGTYNGALCYYQNGIFHTAANTPFLKLPFKATNTINVSVEKDSSITITFENRNIFLNIKNDYCKQFRLDKLSFSKRGFDLNTTIRVNKISANRYALINASKTATIDSVGNMESVQDINTRTDTKDPIYITATHAQDQDYICNRHYLFSSEAKQLLEFKKRLWDYSLLYSFYFNHDHYFSCTSNGLFINDSIQVLKGLRVSSITQDISGNYWVSTLDNGIYCINEHFNDHIIFNNTNTELVKYSVYKNGSLYFATVNNILYSLHHGIVDCIFNYNEYNHTRVQFQNSPAFFIDNNNHYFSFYNNTNTNIDLATGKKTVKSPVNLVDNQVKHIASSGDSVYLQRDRNVFYVDYPHANNKKTVNCILVSGLQFGDRIFGLVGAPDGSVWYSTIKNMFKIINGHGTLQPQFNNLTFKTFDFFNKYMIGYTHDNVLLLCSNVNGKIAIDTIPHQNCIWDKFYTLDTTHILLSTNNLYRVLTINPAGSTEKFSVSIVADPFVPAQSESICSDGTNCYFLKKGSITSVSISSLMAKPAPAELFFTHLKTGKKTYSINNTLQIPFSESGNIAILFSTLSFGSKNISYQYCVSKKNQDYWINLKGEEISLLNSGWGRYTVKIRAKNISGIYSAPVSFVLDIAKPFWASWWFITVVSSIVFIIIYSIIRTRIKYVLSKREKEHDTEIKFMRTEYKALNALMNPHFIFNAMNNVQGLINRDDKLSANESLRVFADLIRQNMHNVSKELIPLQKEMDLVLNYILLEKMRFKELFNYQINISPDLDISDIMVPPLLIQPLVENSIKHGVLPMQSTDSFVHVNIYERKNILFIEVIDNGVGINHTENKDQLHESFGLGNIRTRLQKLSLMQDREISFTIAEVAGENGKMCTVATIQMPLTD